MKKIFVTLALALALISCNDFNNQKEGNGNVTTEKREVTGDFTKIVAGQAIDVEIEQADSYSIEVEADSNLIENIKTSIDNGVLKISSDVNFQDAEKLLVRIKVKQLDEIETTSASNVESVNVFKGKNLRIAASSASEIDIDAEYESIHI
jgi:predicted DNA-binding antitoxin AbrB/MazE fold protein